MCDIYLHTHTYIYNILEKTTVFKIVLDDDVGNRIENELDVVGICGTGEVGVDLFLVFPLVQILKFHLNVGSSFFVCV